MKVLALISLFALGVLAAPTSDGGYGDGGWGDGGSGGGGSGGGGYGGGSGGGGSGGGGSGGGGGGSGGGYGGGSGGGGGGGGGGGSYTPCPNGLYSVAQCCSADVLGVADLNCGAPTSAPTSASNFQSICAKGGQQARCCVLPVLGQDVLCTTPVGL